MAPFSSVGASAKTGALHCGIIQCKRKFDHSVRQPARTLVAAAGERGFFMAGSTSFNQFNPTVGTLTGVSFALITAPELSSIYKGPSEGGTQQMAWGLHGPAGAGLIAFHYQDLPKSFNYSTSWLPQNFQFYADQSADLAAYQGTGQVALWQEFQKGYSAAGVSNVGYRSFIGLGGPACYNTPEGCVAPATLSITYTYTPSVVPEPESYALLLAGLALVVGGTRRRNGA